MYLCPRSWPTTRTQLAHPVLKRYRYCSAQHSRLGTASILDGKTVSKKILEQLRQNVEKDKALCPKFHPKFAIVQVGDNPASALYIRYVLDRVLSFGSD